MEDTTSDVDIVITEADLDLAIQHEQNVSSFFANPMPKRVPDTAMVDAKCVQSGRGYYLVFEAEVPNTWTLQTSLRDLQGASNDQASRAKVQSDLVKGSIDWSRLKTGQANCPHCSAIGLVRCGSCGKVSCHPDGRQGSSFTCAWCGNSGTLKGHIKALDGEQGKGKGKRRT